MTLTSWAGWRLKDDEFLWDYFGRCCFKYRIYEVLRTCAIQLRSYDTILGAEHIQASVGAVRTCDDMVGLTQPGNSLINSSVEVLEVI